MAFINIPGYDMPIDPDEIVKLEISSKKNPHVVIQITLENQREPIVLEFPDRATAINFYSKIWCARELKGEDDS